MVENIRLGLIYNTLYNVQLFLIQNMVGKMIKLMLL